MLTLAIFEKPIDPREKISIADRQSFVRTKRWEDLCPQLGFRDRLMMTEIVGGIVSLVHTTSRLEFLQDGLRGQAALQPQRSRAPRSRAPKFSSSSSVMPK